MLIDFTIKDVGTLCRWLFYKFIIERHKVHPGSKLFVNGP